MIRTAHLLYLRLRAGWLEAQCEHGEELLADHTRRLHNCYDEMRRVKARLATMTPARTLLLQALARRK